MFRYGVENLRRLRVVEPIELKPITLLVGRNSSGKSSFLRSLPLLRQSIATRTRSPILWWGDYVDFGDFSGAIYCNDSKLPMSFTFGLDNLRLRPSTYYYGPSNARFRDLGRVSLKIELKSIGETEIISRFTLNLESLGFVCEIRLNNSGHVTLIKINDRDLTARFSDYEILLLTGSLFPHFSIYLREPGDVGDVPMSRGNLLLDHMEHLVRTKLPNNVGREKVGRLAKDILQAWPANQSQLGSLGERVGIRSWTRLLSNNAGKAAENLVSELRLWGLANIIFSVMREFAVATEDLLSNTLYIGPARARSERYYRYQDLSISEIDSDGKNFPMFLNSLNSSQVSELSDWVEGLFGYGLAINNSSGHLSIEVKVEGKMTNIVDTGYGISQILPVLAQIWWASTRRRSSRVIRSAASDVFLAIEQPELHLHPAHQALLADALVGAKSIPRLAGANPFNVTFIVETHSEPLVNRLGELVSRGDLPHQDISILMFEPEEAEERATRVRVATFGEEGDLKGWPYGFFLPET